MEDQQPSSQRSNSKFRRASGRASPSPQPTSVERAKEILSQDSDNSKITAIVQSPIYQWNIIEVVIIN
jgi:hypothetical protein